MSKNIRRTPVSVWYLHGRDFHLHFSCTAGCCWTILLPVGATCAVFIAFAAGPTGEWNLYNTVGTA